MERWLLDTNALLSFFTDRNRSQQQSTLLLFQKALHGEMELVLHQHVISEMVFTFLNVYRVEKTRTAEVLKDLIEHPGVVLLNEIRWGTVLNLWPSAFPDFGDSIVASVARQNKYPVFTFDKAFGRQLTLSKIGWANP